MPLITHSYGGIWVVRQKRRLAKVAAYVKNQKEKRSTDEYRLTFFLRPDRQKSERSLGQDLAHSKYMYWENLTKVVRFFHPDGGLLWHWTRGVQHRVAMWSEPTCLLVVMWEVPYALHYQKWSLFTMEFDITAGMMPVSVPLLHRSSWTQCPVEQWNHRLPLPLQCFMPAGEGKEHCDFHYLFHYHALRCSTNREAEQGSITQQGAVSLLAPE